MIIKAQYAVFVSHFRPELFDFEFEFRGEHVGRALEERIVISGIRG